MEELVPDMPKEVTIVDDYPSFKNLCITMGDAKGSVPTFDFAGDWTGRDITVITKLLIKEYHKFKRDIRRNKEA